jgi:hypothetical protein
MPDESQASAAANIGSIPILLCPLGRRCTLARHRVISSLITCVRPEAEACPKQVVFGPDAFCGLLFGAIDRDDGESRMTN